MNFDASTLPEAYRELTKTAFAVWVLLHTMTEAELSAGRKVIASALGKTTSSANDVFRELRRKGFVGIVRSDEDRRLAKITLKRRAILKGTDRFIKLS